jgi:hypothetical protein
VLFALQAQLPHLQLTQVGAADVKTCYIGCIYHIGADAALDTQPLKQWQLPACSQYMVPIAGWQVHSSSSNVCSLQLAVRAV